MYNSTSGGVCEQAVHESLGLRSMRNNHRMWLRTWLRIWGLGCCLVAVSAGAALQPAGETDEGALPPPAKSQVDFWRDVGPLFKERCESCHGPEKQMGGLRLDSREAALAGGYSGAVILCGEQCRE